MIKTRRAKRTFSPEFKIEAIEQVVKFQLDVRYVTLALEINPDHLRKWIRLYKQELQGIEHTGNAITPEQREIQHLQAAVALVLDSFQPQPEAVAFQPTIVEQVYEMGSRVNKTDISEFSVALNDVAEELRSSRFELARYADSDFSGAVKVASDIRNHTIHVAGIAESFVLMPPEKHRSVV